MKELTGFYISSEFSPDGGIPIWATAARSQFLWTTHPSQRAKRMAENHSQWWISLDCIEIKEYVLLLIVLETDQFKCIWTNFTFFRNLPHLGLRMFGDLLMSIIELVRIISKSILPFCHWVTIQFIVVLSASSEELSTLCSYWFEWATWSHRFMQPCNRCH